MSLWTKAITEYDASGTCHWTNASHDLTTLHTQYTQFGAVQPLLSDAQTKATPAECPPPSTSGGLFAGIGIVVLLLLLAGGGYFVMQQRRKTTMVTGYLSPSGYPNSAATPYMAAPPASLPYAPPPPTAIAPTLTPMAPASVAAMPESTPVPSAPATPDAPIPVKQRICTAGHVVTDAGARFCPQCGAPVTEV